MQASRVPFIKNDGLCETPFEFLESFRKQDAHKKRLTRNSPSETVAPRNRGLVMDRHADDCD